MFPSTIQLPKLPDYKDVIQTVKSEFPDLDQIERADFVNNIFNLCSEDYRDTLEESIIDTDDKILREANAIIRVKNKEIEFFNKAQKVRSNTANNILSLIWILASIAIAILTNFAPLMLISLPVSITLYFKNPFKRFFKQKPLIEEIKY